MGVAPKRTARPVMKVVRPDDSIVGPKADWPLYFKTFNTQALDLVKDEKPDWWYVYRPNARTVMRFRALMDTMTKEGGKADLHALSASDEMTSLLLNDMLAGFDRYTVVTAVDESGRTETTTFEAPLGTAIPSGALDALAFDVEFVGFLLDVLIHTGLLSEDEKKA